MKALIRNYAGAISIYHGLILCFLLLLSFSYSGAANVIPGQAGAGKIFIQRGAERIAVFNVEIVSDWKSMQQGLSGRSSMPDGHGMLFMLNSSAQHSFWMKGMEFPIDILFFAVDKSLTEVLSGLMPCKECPSYKAPVGTAYVIEINSGLARTLGVKTGDRFVYENE